MRLPFLFSLAFFCGVHGLALFLPYLLAVTTLTHVLVLSRRSAVRASREEASVNDGMLAVAAIA